jgi:ribulose bisphosphate carboxylase small subunit
MPYSLIWEPHGVYKKFTGPVTSAELVQSVNEVANHIRFSAASYEVSDYLGADSTDFSQDALNEVRAVRIGSFSRNPNVRVAIITLDPQIQKRIFSTIAARLTLHQTRIFTDLADANAWLGREATELA